MRRHPVPVYRPRRRRGRWIAGLLLFALLAGAAVAGGGYWYLIRSVPPREGTIVVPGLSGEVRVYRDDRGVPHIEATTAQDLFFAQGFVTAQDRLWQMDLYRRIAGGRLAEVLGESFLDQDRFFRTLGFHEAVQKSLDLADAESRVMLEAYAAGVTAYIDQARSSGLLPVEFRLLGYAPDPWTPEDSLLIGRLIAYQLSTNWSFEVARYRAAEELGWDIIDQYLPSYPSQGPVITPREAPLRGQPDGVQVSSPAPAAAPAEPGSQGDGPERIEIVHLRSDDLELIARFSPPPHLGSNSWAVAGWRSDTGGALLANDPHLAYSAPAIWHQVHLVLEDDFRAIGVSIPGVPGVIIGRNGFIAWAITSLVADSQDLFIQRPNPENPREFLYQGRYEPARVREEVIRVAGREDPVVLEVLETPRHGPILNPVLPGEEPVDVLSLAWTALGPTGEINAILPLMRARNFDEFERAVDLFDMPALSFLYADREGNIGYKAAGLLPRRPQGGGRVPRPAWTGEYDWLGTIPKAELPRSYNPPEGFIVAANNLPASEPYLHYIGDGFFPWRAWRIREVLEEADMVTLQDMRALQLDMTNVHARETLPGLLSVLGREVAALGGPDRLSPVEQEALALLEAWDFVETPSAGAPLVWHLWQRELKSAVVARSGNYELANNGLAEHVLSRLDPAESGRVALSTFQDAVRAATDLQGDNPQQWQWGRWHRLTVYHPIGENVPALGRLFNVGGWAVGGSGATPAAMGFDETTGRVTSGAGWRTVVDLAGDRGFDVLLPGNSGHVLSPYYRDQADMWQDGGLMEQQWVPEQYRRSPLLRLLPP
ncbi:MAG: penicillin acylase family protein [Firmicutes bacterium]|nr:penicillin acylase family protein [Bacillota bacterium]